VVLTTRVRLARNLPNVSFPQRQDENDARIIRSLSHRFADEAELGTSLSLVDLKEVNPGDRRFLRERNIITHEMENSSNSLVIIECEEKFVLMVNEEDHFRIQVIKPGLQIMETYRMADGIDDELNKFVSYAYSDDFGYYTACPSNLGTGLRVSTLLHLPVISLMKSVPDVIKVVKEAGCEMKGAAGEAGKTFGSIYQLFNRVSLGKSEVDIMEEVDEVTAMVLDMENEARDDYLSESRNQLEDRIGRSYGILRYSKTMSYSEAMDHLSNVRLGVVLSLLKNIEFRKINDLMVHVQYSHLQKIADKVFKDTVDADVFRAEYLGSQLTF
jgi:protein arginine kinase